MRPGAPAPGRRRCLVGSAGLAAGLLAGTSSQLAGCASTQPDQAVRETHPTGAPTDRADLAKIKAGRAMGESLALHALQRLSWGPRPGDVQACARRSLSEWLEAQLHPQDLPESPRLLERLQGYETLGRRHAPVLAEFAALQAAALSARRSAEERQQSAREVTQLIQRVQGQAKTK